MINYLANRDSIRRILKVVRLDSKLERTSLSRNVQGLCTIFSESSPPGQNPFSDLIPSLFFNLINYKSTGYHSISLSFHKTIEFSENGDLEVSDPQSCLERFKK